GDRLDGVGGLAEVRQQRDRGAVGEGAGGERGVGGGLAGGNARIRGGELGLCGVDDHRAGAGVHDDLGALGDVGGAGGAHDGDDALLPGEDRRVRGGSAIAGDQRQHLVEVEQRRVGGG